LIFPEITPKFVENLNLLLVNTLRETSSMVRWAAPVGVGLLLLACAGAKTPTAKSGGILYDEDLSAFRPRYGVEAKPPPPTITEKPTEVPATTGRRPVTEQPMHVNRRVDLLLDTLAMRNKAVKHTMGYRIQIYVGNNRQEADAAKLYCYQTLPELYPYMTFNSPTYRVKVGDFLTRMDAERYHDKLKELYPSAMILQDRVEIKKGLMAK
jgi:hypothetical protein